MLNDSVQHLQKATNLIAQAVGAARVASLNLRTRSRKDARNRLHRAIKELRKAQAALPA